MNGFLLLIPFFAIRFGLLAAVNPRAVRRAAYFAPMRGGEKIAYYIYQLSNAAIVLCLPFLSVNARGQWWFYTGLECYVLGLSLCAVAIIHFSSPDEAGLNRDGVYRFSRNPMYVAYFICFVGMALLTRSWFLFGVVVAFQVSAHWIILAEERWCLKEFGAAYAEYMRNVRRYF